MPNKNRKGSANLPKRKSRPLDRGANYNAFGRDPNGRLAFLSAFFFGPDYVPAYTPQQFAGPPEPPRFGPPAPYQIVCLPPGWKPRPLPSFYGAGEALGPPYLDPPSGGFDPKIFAALKHIGRFHLGQFSELLL